MFEWQLLIKSFSMAMGSRRLILRSPTMNTLSNWEIDDKVSFNIIVVHRMNEGYRSWGAQKSVLSNRGLGIKAKNCLYEGVIVPTTLYEAEAWGMRCAE